MIIRWQVAVAAGFFIVATMFIRSTMEQMRHDSGVDLDRLAVATFVLPQEAWTTDRLRRATDRLLEEGSRESSLEAIAASTGLPFGIAPALQVTVARPGAAVQSSSSQNVISGIAGTPSLFRVLGIPVVRGRGFTDADGAAAPPVVVMSELAARQFFASTDPVGQPLIVTMGNERKTATVVGVSRDTDVRVINGRRQPLVFMPLAQHFDRNIAISVRSSSGAAAVAPLREVVRRADGDLSVDIAGAGRKVLTGPLELVASAGRGVLYLGVFTLLLSMAGLFGVQSHVVVYRTREFGVRMSLGASARQIKAMVIRDGARPVADGLILGLWGGIIGRLLVRSYLEIDVAVFDPWMLLLAPMPIVLAALSALYLPAARASRVDPTTALRCE